MTNTAPITRPNSTSMNSGTPLVGENFPKLLTEFGLTYRVRLLALGLAAVDVPCCEPADAARRDLRRHASASSCCSAALIRRAMIVVRPANSRA